MFSLTLQENSPKKPKVQLYFMNLSKETIKELQEILKADYEEEVSFDEVARIANNLLGAFDLLAEINHENYHENKNKQKL